MADDHHEFDCYATTPAEDMVIARRAFAEGDLAHAAHHVACAMSVDPRAEYRSFLDELSAASADPLGLAPLEGQTFFGTVAIRAYILHRLGQHLEAIDLLLQVIGVRPDVPYTAWLEGWLAEDEVLASIEPDAFAVAIQRCLEQLASTALGRQCAPTVTPQLLSLVGGVRERYPDHGPLALIHSRAARQLGDLETAFAVAKAHHQRVPGYLSAVALAGAHRALGELPRAIELFREALGHDPEDLAVRLDIGDLCLEMDRVDEALSAYQEVLERVPDHPWAHPSATYCRFLKTGEPALRDELERYALERRTEAETNERALSLLDAITPYVGYLPGRREALINAVRASLEHGSPPIELALSSLEAPSAVASAMNALGDQSRSLRLHVSEIPQPDPRQPRGPVLYQLWRYEGTRALPNVSPPAADVAAAVAAIARSPYNLDEWTHRGRELASRLGFVAVEPLLSTMVHPPPRPPEFPPWTWTFYVQVAAGLTIAFLDDGWEESVRRRALQSLLDGPVDWTTTASIIALTALACTEEALSAEITDLLKERLDGPPSPISRACVEEPLVHCMLLLPDLPDQLRQALKQRRARLELS